MNKIKPIIIIAVVYCSVLNPSFAQIIKSYNFNQLSSNSYKTFSDSLKKIKKFPIAFENKKIQKDFEIRWKAKYEYIANALDNNNYVKDDLVLPYIEGILNQLVANNKILIPFNVTLLLDRTSVANATSFGDHIISVNAGIILGVQSREELAFYIAHELSHDILMHSYNSLRERTELLNSDEYKESLKNVLSSKFERYSRLMKIADGFSFDRSRHSRYSEQAADSLAIILTKNSNLSFDASFFLNLDTMGNLYERELQKRPQEYLKDLNINYEEDWFAKKSKGLSAAKHNFTDTSSKADSLKTHPDCKLRYSHNLASNSTILNKTPIPKNVKDAAFEISIIDLYVNRNITKCLYRLMQEKEKHLDNERYNFLNNAVFNLLMLSSVELSRFNVLGIRKSKDVSTDYFSLQTFLEKTPETKLKEICQQLDTTRQFTNKEAIEFLSFFKIIATDDVKTKEATIKDFRKKFKENYPNSVFIEIL